MSHKTETKTQHLEDTNKFLKIGVYNGITKKYKIYRAVLASTSLILFLSLHYFLVWGEKPLLS